MDLGLFNYFMLELDESEFILSPVELWSYEAGNLELDVVFILMSSSIFHTFRPGALS